MVQPDTREASNEAARLLALEVPDACHEGVTRNLALLKTHLAIVTSALGDDEPAT